MLAEEVSAETAKKAENIEAHASALMAGLKLEKSDYESLLTVITSMWPVARKINSIRILDTLGKLEAQVKEELKELVFQDYLKTKA